MLDGGPGHPELRLALRLTGSGFEWTDDWVVASGMLLRPGRAAVPVEDAGVQVTTDADGRVVARVEDGLKIEVVRDPKGTFLGVRTRGQALLRTDTGVAATDGRTATLGFEGDDLVSVTDDHGRRTRLVRVDHALRELTFADGAVARVEPGKIDTSLGRWTCTADGPRVRVQSPGSSAWSVERSAERDTVTDPGGAHVELDREDGRLAGWTDPRGGHTRVTTSPTGGAVEGPDGSRTTWTLDEGGLTHLGTPMSASWTFSRADTGAVVGVTDPMGRTWRYDRDGDGLVHTTGASGGWTWTRDTVGRVAAIAPPTGGEVRLGRDAAGRTVRVSDGTGAAWLLARDERGFVRSVADPAGVTWGLRRDALGRITTVAEPGGRTVAFAWRDDDRLTAVTIGLHDRWELLRAASGVLTGLRAPTGALTGFARDAADRVRGVRRADGSSFALGRDAAGDLTSVGDVHVRRDAVGRPLGLALGDEELAWSRDGEGRIVGIDGPGVQVHLVRSADGAIRTIQVDGAPAVTLARDGQGRVVHATGGIGVEVVRDGRGLVTALRRDGAAELTLERDRRGAVVGVRLGEERWGLARDGGLRIVSATGPQGLSLGVARDEGGAPHLVRLADGALAEYARSDEAVDVQVRDPGGEVIGSAAWVWDVAGAVAQLRSAVAWTYRRDPLGQLVAAEAGARVWARSPSELSGPEGLTVELDPNGQPRRGHVARGSPPAWGVAPGDVAWIVGDDGALTEVDGNAGSAKLRHDGVGRLVGWTVGRTTTTLTWDALGRLGSVAGQATDGWLGLEAWGSQRRVPVADAGVARPGGAVLYGPGGGPLTTIHAGNLDVGPTGVAFGPAAAECGAGGRFAPIAGGPLLGLLDAVDPLAGRPTAGRFALPWARSPWEAEPAPSPWADPDASAEPWWSPAGWEASSPWADPLRLLVDAGVLPDGGPRAARAPGVPWLPAALAETVPAPVRDGLAPLADEGEPEVRWVVAHVLAAVPPAPEDFVREVVAPSAVAEIHVVPGLEPSLPPGLR